MSDFFRSLRNAGRRLKARLGAPSPDPASNAGDAATDASGDDHEKPTGPPPIPPEDLARIQSLGRLRAIEAFEGWQHLEAVRKTMASIEQGVDRALDWGRDMRDTLKEQSVVQKAGAWFSRRKSKPGDGSTRSEKILRPARQFASKTYRDAGEWLQTSGMENVQQTLEYLIAHDPAGWVRKRAAKILDRPELARVRNARAAFEAMRNLQPEERERLVAELYPYDLPGFGSFMKAVDLTVNVGLGAVVATNLPGTGSLVHLINMIKTIFKIAHRLHMMSTIHGAAIRDPNALFVVSARILQSLQGWEGAGEHRPLDPAILSELYADAGDDSSGSRPADPANGYDSTRGLPALLGASLKKDLYISVPGVGTVGIGKIGLDDARLDHYIRAFVSAYFEGRRLAALYGEERVAARTAEFAAIYRAFHDREYFPVERRRRKARDDLRRAAAESARQAAREQKSAAAGEATGSAGERIGAGLNVARAKLDRLFGRVSRGYTALTRDEYFEELSENLDSQVREIYRSRAEQYESESAPTAEHGPRWKDGDQWILREVDRALTD